MWQPRRRPSTGYNGSVTEQEDGQEHPGEPRLPAAVAVIVAICLYSLLPEPLLVGPRLVVPALELALFIPLVAANPRRMTRQNRMLRRMSIALVLLIAAANGTSLVLLIRALVSGGTHQGNVLLLAAAQVWLTNVLVFALAYWELDRGGPVARTQTARPGLAAAAFRFPPDEDHDAVAEVAVRSADYLYVSVTNSSAFSPTDTMPLSPRAKMLMAVESVSALMLSILVISRGVSLLR